MGKTILVADDSPTIRRIVELTFQGSGVRVVCATSGEEALSRLATARPDVVLADVVLPGRSGYELCRAIKSSLRPVPVLLFAGTFEPFDRDRARECGADGHLVKPFESDMLRDWVERRLRAEPGQPTAEAPGPRAGVEPDLPPAGEPSPELVDAVARAVVRRLSEQVVREIAAEMIPELAETIIRERIRELESEEP